MRQRDIKYGRPSLPEVEEGTVSPQTAGMRKAQSYKDNLKTAQDEVGSLQWLALKTRPDIAAITATCASLHSRNPESAIKWAQ